MSCGRGSKYKEELIGTWCEKNGYATLAFNEDNHCIVSVANYSVFDTYLFDYKATNEQVYLIDYAGKKVTDFELGISNTKDRLVYLTYAPQTNKLVFYKSEQKDLKTLGEGYVEAEEDAMTITQDDMFDGIRNTFNKWLKNMNEYNAIADKINSFANKFADYFPLPLEETD